MTPDPALPLDDRPDSPPGVSRTVGVIEPGLTGGISAFAGWPGCVSAVAMSAICWGVASELGTVKVIGSIEEILYFDLD